MRVVYARISSVGAPVAQLDRASGYEPEGRGFESLRARHLLGWFHFKLLRLPLDSLRLTTRFTLDRSAAEPSKNEQHQATDPAAEGE